MMSIDYLNILNNQVTPSIDFSSLITQDIFQDDNARIHHSQLCKDSSGTHFRTSRPEPQ